MGPVVVWLISISLGRLSNEGQFKFLRTTMCNVNVFALIKGGLPRSRARISNCKLKENNLHMNSSFSKNETITIIIFSFSSLKIVI